MLTNLAKSLVLFLVGCGSIGQHTVVPAVLPAAQHAWRDWDEVLAHPTAVAVVAHVTGEVRTGPRILIDAKDPRTPPDQKREQWVPAVSYLVTHPTEGSFLMDTGVPVVDENGRCDFGAKPFFWVPCKAEHGQDIVSQLRADGMAIERLRFALVSHLHGDHAGGLHALAAAAPVHLLLTSEEWSAARRPSRVLDGYLRKMLDGAYDVARLPMERAISMPLLGPCLDLFGDGSVWIIPAHGHTQGELAVLINATNGPLLFTFDSSHLRAGLEHGVTPGFTADKKAARDTIARLAAFRDAYPRTRIFYGHEPTQWSERRVVLTEAVR